MCVELQLSRNRNLTLIYFDLLVTYIKVLKMLELIEERSTIVALYTAAYNISEDADKDLSIERTSRSVFLVSGHSHERLTPHPLCRLKILLTDCGDLTRHLIDFFAPSLVFVKPILLQLRDSLALMERHEELRKEYVLNPVHEGKDMAQPALKLVSRVYRADIALTPS